MGNILLQAVALGFLNYRITSILLLGGTVPAPPRLKPVDHQYIRTTDVNANPQLEKLDGDLSPVEAVSFCLELLNRLNPCLSLKTYEFRSQILRDASHVVLPARSGVTP